MSSHHFVKEGQEPALLILDVMRSDIVMPLLEWSPTVLVSSPALSNVLSWGIKIDAVICESRDPDVELSSQGRVRTITRDPDESYLSAGLSFLILEGEKAVNVLANVPQGHFAEVSRFLGTLDVAFVNHEVKWVVATRCKFEKWLPARSLLYLETDDISHLISIENARKTEHAVEIISTGVVKIQSNRPFWIGESLQ